MCKINGFLGGLCENSTSLGVDYVKNVDDLLQKYFFSCR
jgi:hypothetical protein